MSWDTQSCNDRLFPSTTNVSHTPASGQFSSSAVNHDAATPVDTASQVAVGRGCCGDIPSESFDDLHSGPFLPQVLLIDAGCEYKGGYASDVTRTVPVGNGGKFTDEGKTIYSIVLKMQKVSRPDSSETTFLADVRQPTRRPRRNARRVYIGTTCICCATVLCARNS